MPRCAGRKEDGSPCERIAGASHTYCYSHDPKRAAERRRNASRGGRSKANAEIAGLKAQLKEARRGRPLWRGGPGGGNRGQPDNQQPGPASRVGAQDKGNRGARGPAGGARGRAEGTEERMSTKK